MVVRHAQKDLIKKVWPDKLLYGSILLLVTAVVGFLHGLVMTLFDVSFGDKVPDILRLWPPEIIMVLSAVSAVLAFVSLKRLSTTWGLAGAAVGVLSFALLGLGSLLSLAAFGFLAWARAEGEDDIPEADRLDPDEWPDKSLGASLVLLLGGLLTAAWGFGVFNGTINFAGDGVVFGAVQVATGLVCLAAAWTLYHQRAKGFGLAAGALCVLAAGAYVLGPILGAVAIGLTLKASREGEFDGR